MKIGINGIGLWGYGMTSWSEFEAGLRSGFANESANPSTPAPAAIPPRERRRAPLSVKMAIEVINQAATMAAIDEQTMCSVFASVLRGICRGHRSDHPLARHARGDDKSVRGQWMDD